MPGKEKRTRLANRREIIIKAAGRLFRQKGYEGTSVRDIAEAVGLQSGSLFFHFTSKEEILVSLLEGGLRRAVAILDDRLAKAKSPEEKLPGHPAWAPGSYSRGGTRCLLRGIA